jgi:hypothetical protein
MSSVPGGGYVRQKVVAGAAAGPITVAGLEATAILVSVLSYASTWAATEPKDLTAEFTVTAANTISNVGGTATTGSRVVVTWYDVTL